MRAFFGLRRRALLMCAVLAIDASALLPAGALAGAPPTRFSLTIGGSCISGYSVADTNIHIVWREADGDLKAMADVLSGNDGYWVTCPSADLFVTSGDRIDAGDGTYTRHYVVPDLSLKVDRVSNRFRGTAPAGRTIRLSFPDGIFADHDENHSVRVGANGRWSYDPERDLLGGQFANVSWKSPNNDQLFVSAVAPNVSLTLGSADFSGYAAHFADIHLSIQRPANGKTAAGSASGDRYMHFLGEFRRNSGRLFNVAPGDHLRAPSLAADADWIVPRIDGTGDAASDIVKGRCHDAGTFKNLVYILLYRGASQEGYVIGNTPADGRFEIDFSDPESWDGTFFAEAANVKHGDTVYVDCLQSTGDWVNLIFRVP